MHDLDTTIQEFCDYLNEKYNSDVRMYMTNSSDLKLDNIRVPKHLRKQGLGTSIMKEVINFADKSGLRLILTTAVKDPYAGTTSSDRLKRFYKRFDFVENKGRNKDYSISGNMLRNPNLTSFIENVDQLDELGEYKKADTLISLLKTNFF